MNHPAQSALALRNHEIRVVLAGGAPDSFQALGLAGVLDSVLPDWHAAPLLADDAGIWLVTGYVDEQVGTAEYACRAHSLVQRILGTGRVVRAEADIPVTAFIDRERVGISGGDDDEPPGSEASRWARDAIRCEDAWAMEPTRGAGILIGHPDTGYTLHPNLGAEALDLTRDRDFLSGDDDALDPLIPPADLPRPLSFPGHGTTTASVMVGRGSEEGGIVGVAPGATIVPLRVAVSVIQVFDSDVARAVDHARLSGCHVVSISVGGKGLFGLEAAILRAVDSGMIVLAAAGNNVGFVIEPAAYPSCLAVAATGPRDQPWPESSRGPSVDICAPGWGVHVADYSWANGKRPEPRVRRSSGTSYAATHLAGVAALWLAHHGVEAVRDRYGARVQAAFLHLLQNEGSRTPAGWDSSAFGAGIVDAAEMLAAPLPDLDVVRGEDRSRAVSPVARLGALVELDAGELEQGLAARLGCSGGALHSAVARFEGELAFHLLEHEDFRAMIRGETADDDGIQTLDGSSPEFRRVFGIGRPGLNTP